jgi:quinol monooxygenase YgiN
MRRTERMSTQSVSTEGRLLHLVTLACKDQEHARHCIAALTTNGRPDALAFHCISYEFGVKEGASDTVYLVERWSRWEDLDALLAAKVVPALTMYNQLLKRPFDPAQDTVRIRLSDA